MRAEVDVEQGQNGRDLESLAERFALEVVHHADVVGRRPDDEAAVIAAINALEAAARAYFDIVLERTGWSAWPIPWVENAEEPSPRGRVDAQPAPGKGARRFELTARYEIEVSRPRELKEFVEQRLRRVGLSLDGDPYDHPVDALARLYELDGWNPEKYSATGVEVTDSEWRCGPVGS